MLINADFDKRAVVHAGSMEWIPSPMKGVDRRMLDRVGAESGHATSIVRYAPNSSFSPHVHTGGEEFLVLDGVFQDEHGDFPTGTYVRNPPTSRHTPRSDEGCTIFVKLWQFDPDDRTQISIDTNQRQFTGVNPSSKSEMLLFEDGCEQVSLEKWPANQSITIEAPHGAEILVLQGGFNEAGEGFIEHSWLRLPGNSRSTAISGPQGARVWIKRGKFAQAPEIPSS